MGHHVKAETVLKNALKRTPATIKKRDNRVTRGHFKAWTVAALLERYQDPRAILLEIASTPTKALAKQMNGSLADAVAERRLCAQAVLPYCASKMPLSVEMKTTKAITLNILDERQYQELIDVAAEPADNDDGSFSLQLLPAAQPAEAQSKAQSTQQRGETTAAQSAVTAQDTAQAGGDRPVTPSMAAASPPDRADPPGGFWLPDINEYWRRYDARRTQPMPDAAPARDDRDSWTRGHEGGAWPPDRK